MRTLISQEKSKKMPQENYRRKGGEPEEPTDTFSFCPKKKTCAKRKIFKKI
jgi:hypothetical protein